MSDSGAIRAGLKGKAYLGDALGVTFPANVTTVPGDDWDPDDFIDLGLMGEEGLSEAIAQEQKDFFAWGYPKAPARVIVTKASFSFQATFWETNAHVVSLYYATPISGMTNVAATTGTGAMPQQVHFDQAQIGEPDVRAMGFDVLDGDHVKRIIIPRCIVAERGNIVYKGDDVTAYQMTFRTLLDFEDATPVDVKRQITNMALA